MTDPTSQPDEHDETTEDFDPSEATEDLATEDYDEVPLDDHDATDEVAGVDASSDDADSDDEGGADDSSDDDSDDDDSDDDSDDEGSDDDSDDEGSDDGSDDDSDDDDSSGDDSGDDSGDGASGDDDSDDDAGTSASDADASGDEDDNNDEDDKDGDADGPAGSSGAGRRRRRGRRGRGGRGRGGSGSGTADSGSASDAAGDDKASDEPAQKSGGQADLEKAIAQGGTRTAARKQGGGSRGGRGGGGGGRGGSNRRGSRTQGGVPEEIRRAILDGPPKTMLVSSREDRTQIVVMEERTAVEHYMTRTDDVTYVGNVYMARVQNVLSGMEAAFLDIGKGRNGVLYAGEVNYDELDVEDGGVRIEDALKPGQAVLVQVTKDPMGSKGPRLTMQISLAGRYMVLSPNSDVFGISRKLTDKERDRLRRIVKEVKPKHHGVIVRTAAADATDEAIKADLVRLLAKWDGIAERAEGAKVLSSVYEEPPLVVKVIRDNFGSDFDRLVVDDETLHGQVKDYLEEVAPELMEKVHLWQPPAEGEGERELLAAYEVTEQLRKATDRKVWLPSGGYLIIETTEAMKVIDVNTGKFTGKKGSNLEDVVFKTNIEAAKEIVRQLRLRDMGGIIIIDFIDMLLKANQDEVIRTLERELLRDRTKTRVSDVSRLGLVQMTRKNVSAGLVESFSHTCDHCQGRGFKVEIG